MSRQYKRDRRAQYKRHASRGVGSMGQYHYVVNLTKRQYLHPHKFDDGLKLMEFGPSAGGTMAGLALLLADANGEGGGDWRGRQDPRKLVGSWAGDRIAICGDYGDKRPLLVHCLETDDQKIWQSEKHLRGAVPDGLTVYSACCYKPEDEESGEPRVPEHLRFEDISGDVLELLRQDGIRDGR